MSGRNSTAVRSWGLVATQVVLLVAVVLVPEGDHWATPRWLLTLAAWCTLGGFVLVVVASVRLGRALTASPAPRSDLVGAGLRTTGLYGLVRHPIYSGVMLIVAGVVLRTANVLGLVLGALVVVFFNAKARWEESLLSERYPDYAAYSATTPRFLPSPFRRSR